MYSSAEQRLERLGRAGIDRLLQESRIGLEKENLRVASNGCLAQTAHPAALGAPLTHPYITTDYSEALMEFVTPPLTDVERVLEFLGDVQTYVYDHLGEEFLWAASMPCVCSGDGEIQIARYGRSNPGMLKHIYRRGLAHRYGRMMQVIAGVHFNFSLSPSFWRAYQAHVGDHRPEQTFVDEQYFALMRNLQRLGWLVPYLFGGSPAVCQSFLGDQPHDLEAYDGWTYYAPCATSLRMSDIGYQNSKESKAGLRVSYDDLDAYVDSLFWATQASTPEYEQIGVKAEGTYRQLNSNILQIENEYYSSLRPKQLTRDGERPLRALRQRGVGYIELRSMDVNPFEPLGLTADDLRFLEALLVFCLLADSPRITETERAEIDFNQQTVCSRGRCPNLRLQCEGATLPMREWLVAILDAMEPVCDVLDDGQHGQPYREALAAQREKAIDASHTPAARVLAEMREHDEPFHTFARRKSLEHRAYFAARKLPPGQRAELDRLGLASVEELRALEEADDLPFDDYLQRFLQQTTA